MSGSEPEDEDLSAVPVTADSMDALLAEAVSTPPAIPLLAAASVVADRYQIERVLGVGGMGAVYLARDRTLGRSVALKLHRAATDSSRLHAEAMAMARLAHPNVVTVFEVGEHERRTFVAMEYVEGDTLRTWLAQRDPDRGPILDALLAAGEGLAAAHVAALVHRDVKPENILIGTDGRARIGDFGLAQASSNGAEVRVPIGPETATGMVLGTPAYMAPEQIAGGQVDARTDQFAFCVVAWEALCGERPFTGADTIELRAAIERAIPQAPRRRIPARIRQVLQRGLAFDPAQRWASMPALLAALRSARRHPQLIASALAVAALTAGAAAWALWPVHDPVAACDELGTELDAVLPISTGVALVTAVRDSGAPHASARALLIEHSLEAQRTRTAAVTLAACRARASHQWSPELAAASHECLRDHARSVREVLLSTSPERADVVDLGLLAVRLPEAESCGDARVLAGWRALAANPADLDAVIDARARLDSAIGQADLGRMRTATAIYDAVLASPVIDVPSVHARAELLESILEVAAGSYVSAEHRLAEAYFAMRAADDADMSLRIVAELITVTATIRRDAATSEKWIRDGLADAERERVRRPAAAAFVYLTASSAAATAGDSELALRRAEMAENILDARNVPMLRLSTMAARAGAYADLGRIDEALAASDVYLGAVKRVLGEQHPTVADALGDRVSMLLEAHRTSDALAAAREAKAILDGEVDSMSTTLAAIEMNLGAALLDIGDPSAKVYLGRARARWIRAYGEDHPDVALADSNLALIYMDAGDIDRALSALRNAARVQEKALGPEHIELAATLYNLAVAERNVKAYEQAMRSARRSAAIYGKLQPGSVRHVFALAHIAMIANLDGHPADALAAAEQALTHPASPEEPTGPGWARIEAARALIALGRDPPRARRLLAEAHALYQTTNLPFRLAEIEALRARVP